MYLPVIWFVVLVSLVAAMATNALRIGVFRRKPLAAKSAASGTGKDKKIMTPIAFLIRTSGILGRASVFPRLWGLSRELGAGR